MEKDYCSQCGSQDLPDTQSASQQDFQGNCLNENVWGRLLSLNRYISFYDLVKDSYTFGRGYVTCRFDEQNFDSSLLPVVSKLHFQISRDMLSTSNLTVLQDFSSNGTFVNDILIGKNNRKVLRHNDQISIANANSKVFVFYDCNNSEISELPHSLREKYTLTRKIGHGTYGEVRLAYVNTSVKPVAIKILSKNVMSENGTTIRNSNVKQIQNEIDLLKSVDHPCIIRLIDFIESEDKIFIVMEYAEGGELFERITNNIKLSESISKLYFYQLVSAVSYLHSKKITHRDIKPENILLETNEEITVIKLTDFGLSKITKDISVMTSFCGTQNYIAPELISLSEEQRNYTSKVDMWSLGVVLYACLSGCLPFRGKDDAEKLHNIRLARFSFASSAWDVVSNDAKDLIRALLVVDPNLRFSAQDVFAHPWMKDPSMMKKVEKLIGDASSN